MEAHASLLLLLQLPATTIIAASTLSSGLRTAVQWFGANISLLSCPACLSSGDLSLPVSHWGAESWCQCWSRDELHVPCMS
jgi:hypothetical protein